KKLKPLALKRRRVLRQSGKIAAGTAEARHQAKLDRVAADREHDGNLAGSHLGCACRCIAAGRRDDRRLDRYEIGRERAQALILTFSPAILDLDVFAFHEAALAKAVMESSDDVAEFSGFLRVEETDHRHWGRLRSRTQRPRDGSSTGKSKKSTTLHWRFPALADVIVTREPEKGHRWPRSWICGIM